MNAKAKSKAGVTLNLFGEGYNVLRFDESRISYAEIEQRAAEMKRPPEQALLELDFYDPFAERGIKSWKDVCAVAARGTSVNRLSWLEIRSEGRKRRTSTLEELFLVETLFPICEYTVTEMPIVKSINGSFYVLEKEVGKLDTFFLEGSMADLENLAFTLNRFTFPEKSLYLLTNVSCNNEPLVRKDPDTVVSKMSVILT